MDKLSPVTDTFAGRAAILGGAALTAGGVTEIVHSQRGAGDIDSVLAMTADRSCHYAPAPMVTAWGQRPG